MPRTSPIKRTSGEIRKEKEALYADVEAGRLTIGQATRRMRKIVGMTQKDYAEKVLKVYPRVLMEVERDRGNPTLETLNKIAIPFGLRVGFVTRKSMPQPEVQTVNSSICEAIRKRAAIQFRYRGRLLVVEPQCHGISAAGKEVLRAVQTGGDGETGKNGFGKLFEVAKMTDIRETGKVFDGQGRGLSPKDKGMVLVHCHLSGC